MRDHERSSGRAKIKLLRHENDPHNKIHTSMIYFRTAGITPEAPFVGEVTILPPEALTSLTAIA